MVRIGTTITLFYVTQEIIAKSRQLFSDLESQKEENAQKDASEREAEAQKRQAQKEINKQKRADAVDTVKNGVVISALGAKTQADKIISKFKKTDA